MATNTIVVPTEGVEGNITSCGIQTAQISVSRDSVWAPMQTVTYQSYNLCTKEIISTYQLPEPTGMAFPIGLAMGLGIFGAGFLVLMFIYVALASWNDARKGTYGNSRAHGNYF